MLGQRAARSFSPHTARALIREASERAVRAAGTEQPSWVAEPCDVVFDLTSVTLADICAAIRSAPLTVGFGAETILDAIRWMRVCSMLAGHLR